MIFGSPKGRFVPALTGRGDFSYPGSWSIAPPIFSFYSQYKKRKRAVHGPKEKNKGMRLRGRVWSAVLKYECPCPRRGAGGSFGSRGMDCPSLSADIALTVLVMVRLSWGPRKIRRFCGERRKEWSGAEFPASTGNAAGGISSDENAPSLTARGVLSTRYHPVQSRGRGTLSACNGANRPALPVGRETPGPVMRGRSPAGSQRPPAL